MSHQKCSLCKKRAFFKREEKHFCSYKCSARDWVSKLKRNPEKLIGIDTEINIPIVQAPDGTGFMLTQEIGGGSFGKVFGTILVAGDPDMIGSAWVLKTFNLEDESTLEEFVREVTVNKFMSFANEIDPNLCDISARCGISSFISTNFTDSGVIVQPVPPESQVSDLATFIDEVINPDFLTVRSSLNDNPQAYLNSEIYKSLEIRLLFFIIDLVDDVARLHESGLAHRDLKPANTLVDISVWEEIETPSRLSVLIDFNGSFSPLMADPRVYFSQPEKLSGIEEARTYKGFERWQQDEIPSFIRNVGTFGTPGYEEILPRNLDNGDAGLKRLQEADIYTLGVMIYELLDQEFPEQLAQNTGPVSIYFLPVTPRVRPAIKTIIDSMMQPISSERLSARDYHRLLTIEAVAMAERIRGAEVEQMQEDI